MTTPVTEETTEATTTVPIVPAQQEEVDFYDPIAALEAAQKETQTPVAKEVPDGSSDTGDEVAPNEDDTEEGEPQDAPVEPVIETTSEVEVRLLKEQNATLTTMLQTAQATVPQAVQPEAQPLPDLSLNEEQLAELTDDPNKLTA